jgi:hypothetical protein
MRWFGDLVVCGHFICFICADSPPGHSVADAQIDQELNSPFLQTRGPALSVIHWQVSVIRDLIDLATQVFEAYLSPH